MRHTSPGLTLAGIAALFLVACGGGGGGSGSSSSGGSANTPPVANAGTNQTVNSGVTVTLNGTASSDANGTIASYAWTQTAGTPAVTLTNSTAAQPTFPAPTVATATLFTFSLVVTDNLGAASAASTVNVTVNPAAAGNTNVTGQITFARVPFKTTGLNPGLDYANPVQRPARQVIVRALNAGTQAVLATGSTDDTGNYTLSVPNNTSISIQVVAQMQRATTPQWNVRVQDGLTAASPYSFTESGSFNSSAGVAHNVAIPTGIDANGTATGTRASGPFAALDTVYQGMLTVLGVAANTNIPTLIIDWGSQSEGTFFTAGGGQHIALLADLTEDTDEFDQHVVAHEFGHYIEYNFSRADSIGGAHGLGDMLDPRVAFGEGFGYAFAAIVLNDPNARDSFVDTGPAPFDICGVAHCSGGFNIEANPPGTNNQACWCSESSVWSILWDLYDTPADTNDTLALGFTPLWEVLAGPQRTTPAFTTIFSFITALKAARPPGESAAINTLVEAQQITAANIDAFGTTESHFVPGANSLATLPIYTNISAGIGTVTVASSDDLGRHNKIGNRRFFRFTPSATGSVTITLGSSTAGPDPDFRVYRSGVVVLDATDPPAATEVGTLSVTAGTTYIIDAYDCSNGCPQQESTPSGDNILSLTIN
jgi:hypothetical protein